MLVLSERGERGQVQAPAADPWLQRPSAFYKGGLLCPWMYGNTMTWRTHFDRANRHLATTTLTFNPHAKSINILSTRAISLSLYTLICPWSQASYGTWKQASTTGSGPASFKQNRGHQDVAHSAGSDLRSGIIRDLVDAPRASEVTAGPVKIIT